MNNNLEFLDVLNIVSFVIGVLNYNETLTQTDKQDLISGLDTNTQLILKEIHSHLEIQDKLLRDIKEAQNDRK